MADSLIERLLVSIRTRRDLGRSPWGKHGARHRPRLSIMPTVQQTPLVRKTPSARKTPPAQFL